MGEDDQFADDGRHVGPGELARGVGVEIPG
jgi:hypothetical protein